MRSTAPRACDLFCRMTISAPRDFQKTQPDQKVNNLDEILKYSIRIKCEIGEKGEERNKKAEESRKREKKEEETGGMKEEKTSKGNFMIEKKKRII